MKETADFIDEGQECRAINLRNRSFLREARTGTGRSHVDSGLDRHTAHVLCTGT